MSTNDLRIVDAPAIPEAEFTPEVKLPTGGKGNYSVTADIISSFVKKNKNLIDKTYFDTAINNVTADISAHEGNFNNPHKVTKAQLGLSNVNNTADLNKPVSVDTADAIRNAVEIKADKTNVYTKTETDNKLALKASLVELSTKEDKTRVTALTRLGGVDYWMGGSYPIYGEVRLTNGGIVRSLIANNTNNPNTNMTGWALIEGIVNLRSFGAKGDGVTDDSQAFINAISSGIGYVEGVDGDVYLLNRTYNDGTIPSSQYSSYCVNPSKDCVIDLKGSTIRRGKLGEGDNISMHQVFYVIDGVGFTIRNGIIDMNNHNARFAVWQNNTKPNHGAEDLIFINTRNNGLSRSVAGSSDIITIRNTRTTWVKRVTMYVGSDGDLSGDCDVDFNIPNFGVRISTRFVEDESLQTESSFDCYAEDFTSFGPFLWQPIEIAGSGTKKCYARNIKMYKPILSSIDLDKGCKQCWFEDVYVYNPRAGYSQATAGGNGFVPIRFQGYWNTTKASYAENCWVRNVHFYDFPSAFGASTTGTLIEFTYAKNCTAYDVYCHDTDREFWEVVSSAGALSKGNEVVNLNGIFRRINARNLGQCFTIKDSSLKLDRGLVLSPATYLDDDATDITLINNDFSNYHTYSLTLLQGYGVTVGKKPKINLLNNRCVGINTLFAGANLIDQTNIQVVGNMSYNQINADVVPNGIRYFKNYSTNIGKSCSASKVYQFPAIASGLTQSTNIELVGVTYSDVIGVSFSATLQGTRIWASVTGTNQVTVYHQNTTDTPKTLDSATIRVYIE